MTDRYAVIGNPVAHSKSPEIHVMFARETGQDISYERILAPLDRFTAVVTAFREAGGKGANVTVPFKLEAFRLSQVRTPRANLCGAVNTLRFDDGSISGDNTDGVGLVRDIAANLGVPIAGRRILLLGAGGAARGVLGELLAARPAQLAIANRTHARAVEVADALRAVGSIDVPAPDALREQAFDIVINATSASLDSNPDAKPSGICANNFAAGALAYDMVYAKAPPFLTFAAAAGARTADGLGMLVEQAAEAFYIWRGLRPSTAPVLAHLRNQLQGK